MSCCWHLCGRGRAITLAASHRWTCCGLTCAILCALAAFQRYIIHNNIGWSLFHLNEWTRAEENYRHALRAAPAQPPTDHAYINLATLYKAQGRIKSTIKAYRAAVMLTKQLPTWAALGKALMQVSSARMPRGALSCQAQGVASPRAPPSLSLPLPTVKPPLALPPYVLLPLLLLRPSVLPLRSSLPPSLPPPPPPL